MNHKFAKSKSMIVVFLSLAVCCLGCSGSPGGSSPEDVFAKVKKASKNKDYKTLVNCMDEDSQNEMAAGMAMMVVMIEAMSEMAGKLGGDSKGPSKDDIEKIKKIAKKHGVTEDAMKDLEGKGSPAKAKDEIASIIKDKPAFISEMIKAMESMDDSPNEGLPAIGGELKDVEIDGDTAEGVVVEDDKESPIFFVKEDGRWKISMNKMR